MSMTELAAAVAALKQYGFKDENGHPLENCQEFVWLVVKAENAVAEVGKSGPSNGWVKECKFAPVIDPLSHEDKEDIKAAILQSAIQSPHQDFSALANDLCSALDRVNRFDEPRTSGGTSTEEAD